MSESVVKIDITSTMDALVKEVGNFGNEIVAKGADRILGSFGSESRKIIGKSEESELKMGHEQIKYNKKKHSFIKSHTYFDSRHGWYRSTSKVRPRIIGFNYENKAYQPGGKKYKARFSAVSSGYVYSLLYNLWGKKVTYKKKSPLFHGGWYGSERFGRWGKNAVREPRVTLTEGMVTQAIAPTMARAEDDLRELLREKGYNV